MKTVAPSSSLRPSWSDHAAHQLCPAQQAAAPTTAPGRRGDQGAGGYRGQAHAAASGLRAVGQPAHRPGR